MTTTNVRPTNAVNNDEVNEAFIYTTIITDEYGKRLTAYNLTLEQLRQMVEDETAPEKSKLKWLKLARFGNKRTEKNCLRHDANVLKISGIELDHDGKKIPFDEAVATITKAGLRTLLYTTASHTEAAPKWRVICPTSKELDPAERSKLVARVNGLFGGVFAGESFALSQGFLYGSVEGNQAKHRTVIVDGDFIDARDDLDAGALYKNGATHDTAKTSKTKLPFADVPPPNVDELDLSTRTRALIKNGPADGEFKSRSHAACSACGQLRRAGVDHNVALALIMDKANKISDHVYDQKDPRRCAERIVEAVYGEVSQPDDEEDPRAVIQVTAGQTSRIHQETEQALIKLGGIYQRCGKVVSAGWSKGKNADGDDVIYQVAIERQPHALTLDMDRSAQFVRWNYRKKEFTKCDPPLDVAVRFLQHRDWDLPVLSGLISAPTIRSDGSLLVEPGYDSKTGLLYNPRGVVFPPILKHPTKDDAVKALELLKGLLVGFPFVDEASRAVALSLFLTAIARPCLDFTPIHGFTAPLPGTGKSLIVDAATIIATGFRAAVCNWGDNNEENGKLLGALILESGFSIAIDNIEKPLESSLLNEIVTQEMVKPRILGFSNAPATRVTALLTITGNALKVVGDLTRRTLLSELDAECERPELRVFEVDLLRHAAEHRANYVAAALTILKAHRAAGSPSSLAPLGSFDQWSRHVRDALIWLGCDDADTTQKARTSDPKLEALTSLHYAS